MQIEDIACDKEEQIGSKSKILILWNCLIFLFSFGFVYKSQKYLFTFFFLHCLVPLYFVIWSSAFLHNSFWKIITRFNLLLMKAYVLCLQRGFMLFDCRKRMVPLMLLSSDPSSTIQVISSTITVLPFFFKFHTYYIFITIYALCARFCLIIVLVILQVLFYIQLFCFKDHMQY